MGNAGWGEILSVFFACALKPGLIGLPLAAALNFSFPETLFVAGGGGVAGSVLFTFLSEEILQLWHRFLDQFFPNRKRAPRFSRTTRVLVRVKKYFGIIGLSILSPLLLSIPLGCFFAIRFFGHRSQTILYMSISAVAWTVVLYFFYNGFFDSLVRIFRG